MMRILPKPDSCPECGSTCFIELHNLDSKYDDNPSNWRYLCRKCHMHGDGRSDMLRNFGFAMSSSPVMEYVECLCGCGQRVRAVDVNGKKQSYARGHCPNGRFKKGQRPWNYGITGGGH